MRAPPDHIEHSACLKAPQSGCPINAKASPLICPFFQVKAANLLLRCRTESGSCVLFVFASAAASRLQVSPFVATDVDLEFENILGIRRYAPFAVANRMTKRKGGMFQFVLSWRAARRLLGLRCRRLSPMSRRRLGPGTHRLDPLKFIYYG